VCVWLPAAGGSVPKPVSSCYAMTTTNDMTNQMRAGDTTTTENGASMDTARLVSSFAVHALCGGVVMVVGREGGDRPRPACWPAKPKPSYAPTKHGHKLLNGGTKDRIDID